MHPLLKLSTFDCGFGILAFTFRKDEAGCDKVNQADACCHPAWTGYSQKCCTQPTNDRAEDKAHTKAKSDDKPGTAESLSERELQTLVKIASGKRLSDIAEELMLSPKTVSVYRARVLEKLKLANNAELTVYAIRNRLV